MFQTIRNWVAGLWRSPGIQSGDPGTYSTPTPAPVNFDSAMQLSAVWACARLISETIAALPVTIKRNGEIDRTSDLARLFALKPNRYQTKNEFFETFILNLVMLGNAYALKQYVGTRLVGLLPLNSAQVEPKLLKDGSVVYCYYHDGGVDVIASENMWHVKLFGNGIVGLSPLGYARNTIGIAIAGESQTSRIYQNGGKPTGILTIDHVLKDEQRDQIRGEFDALRAGNTDRLMVLEAGMKYQQVSLSPNDIQLLESRRFQIEDIARFFGVPSVLINDTSGSTVWGSGVSEIVQGFYKLNLRPYLERLESSIRVHLIATAAQATTEIEFDFDALLRASKQDRIKANGEAINSAQLTPNEAREAEGLPAVDNGDKLLINSTLIPVDMAGARLNSGSTSNAEPQA